MMEDWRVGRVFFITVYFIQPFNTNISNTPNFPPIQSSITSSLQTKRKEQLIGYKS